MSDILLPPIPPGGITDSGTAFNPANINPSDAAGSASFPALPSMSTLGGLGALGSLPALPSLPSLGGSASSATSGTGQGSTSKSSVDSYLTRAAFLILGVVIIAGAIFVYKGNLDFRITSPTPKFGFKK
jgi:hypothetical protein